MTRWLDQAQEHNEIIIHLIPYYQQITMPQLFTYLAPPLVGAFIGYMTNYVAIRMLFRPLRPWHLFGFRLPMTPGVIPSKRHDLAKNIGHMVGRHLLTGPDISKALHNETFQIQLSSMIDTKVDTLLSKDLGPLSTIIPNRFRSYFEVGIKILRWRSLKILHNYLASDAVAQTMAELIAAHIDVLLQKQVNSLLPATNRAQLLSFIETALDRILNSPKTEQWLQEYLEQKLKTIIAEKSINDLLPKPFTLLFIDLLEKEVPNILTKTAAIANEPKSRDKIVVAICEAISNFIAGLGPMAALASGFLSPELIKNKVNEYLDDHSDDLNRWLLSEDVQDKTKNLLKATVVNFLNKPLAEILADVDSQKIDEISQKIGRQATRTLQDPQIHKSISNLLGEALESLADKQIQDVITDLVGKNGIQSGKHWTSEEITKLIRSPQVKRIVDRIISDLLAKNLSRPVGSLAHLFPKAVQNGLGEYLLQQTNILLKDEVPGLINSLNIEQLVTKKVDSLDLIRLENLLLSIMQEQFKYINLFGGFLGFIIGLLNLAFIL